MATRRRAADLLHGGAAAGTGKGRLRALLYLLPGADTALHRGRRRRLHEVEEALLPAEPLGPERPAESHGPKPRAAASQPQVRLPYTLHRPSSQSPAAGHRDCLDDGRADSHAAVHGCCRHELHLRALLPAKDRQDVLLLPAGHAPLHALRHALRLPDGGDGQGQEEVGGRRLGGADARARGLPRPGAPAHPPHGPLQPAQRARGPVLQHRGGHGGERRDDLQRGLGPARQFARRPQALCQQEVFRQQQEQQRHQGGPLPGSAAEAAGQADLTRGGG
mmetsp:Transcript_123788/g.344536  ORF Transcript_123788/g.344536 Transcript_123788/m.344536 type:complete len:277 (+) Transcript_123788:1164-1994(+)